MFCCWRWQFLAYNWDGIDSCWFCFGLIWNIHSESCIFVVCVFVNHVFLFQHCFVSLGFHSANQVDGVQLDVIHFFFSHANELCSNVFSHSIIVVCFMWILMVAVAADLSCAVCVHARSAHFVRIVVYDLKCIVRYSYWMLYCATVLVSLCIIQFQLNSIKTTNDPIKNKMIFYQ